MYKASAASLLVVGLLSSWVSATTILNVSYDPTRELYVAFNEAFKKQFKGDITIEQSHGGSGKQARSVIDGLEADVVTLAVPFDIDAIAKAGLLPREWQKAYPNRSAPYTSTIVFLVRKGNPKQIRDWGDLTKPGIGVITPNPKTSGGARWNYLAAWGYALGKTKSEKKAQAFLKALFANVPVLDSGARGSTTTFVNRKLGDVLLAWENEALLITRKEFPDEYEIVYPSVSILAEPSVAVVQANAKKKGSLQVASAYLRYLYSDKGQRIVAQHYFRPTSKTVSHEYRRLFKPLKLINATDLYPDWDTIQRLHFDDGAIFDTLVKR